MTDKLTMQELLGAANADVEIHADRILRAAGSSLSNYTMPATRNAILGAVREAITQGAQR